MAKKKRPATLRARRTSALATLQKLELSLPDAPDMPVEYTIKATTLQELANGYRRGEVAPVTRAMLREILEIFRA